jgi:hypothetical protein
MKSTAMPEAVWPANTQGEAPNWRLTLNTFFPDVRGVTVPLKEHPPEEVAEKVPLD